MGHLSPKLSDTYKWYVCLQQCLANESVSNDRKLAKGWLTQEVQEEIIPDYLLAVQCRQFFACCAPWKEMGNKISCFFCPQKDAPRNNQQIVDK